MAGPVASKEGGRITPALVDRLALTEELPARCRILSPSLAEEVLRFGRDIGQEIVFHSRLRRGMDAARERIAAAATAGKTVASGAVIAAGAMPGARGRFHREWHAPEGGLWLTVILADTLLPPFAALVPLAAGVAVCEFFLHIGVPASIRWVNDVLVAGRKAAGILAETFRAPSSGERFLLLGIGVNLNNRAFPPELANEAVAAAEAAGRSFPLTASLARLLVKLRWNIGLLHLAERDFLQQAGPNHGQQDASLAPLLLERYRGLCDTVGRRVRFGFDVVRRPQYTGRVVGIDDDGALMLRLDADGGLVCERAGEVRYIE